MPTSKLKWILGKIADIVFDIVAGIFLYLILGGYISQPFSEISPYLPSLLAVSLFLAIVAGIFYRFFKSVRFHRFVERVSNDLTVFLKSWDEFNNLFVEVSSSRLEDTKLLQKFEDTRTGLQYTYPKIASAVGITKYHHVDHIRGISVQNYDVIGNLLVKSPFTGMKWFNREYVYQEFKGSWDTGRTILVYTIGYFDEFRKSAVHQLFWLLRLVPMPKKINQNKDD